MGEKEFSKWCWAIFPTFTVALAVMTALSVYGLINAYMGFAAINIAFYTAIHFFFKKAFR